MREVNMAYKNINAAVFCTQGCVEGLAEKEENRKRLDFLDKHIQYNKVYLETYRGYSKPGIKHLEELIISDEKLNKVKALFQERGVKCSGAITTTGFSVGGRFKSLCYSNESDRELLKKVVRKTASHFDEMIFDDFYFTNCKCHDCLREKGDRSWAEFRTDQMTMVSRELVHIPAKEVNPGVNLIIKFPNWYEHYQSTGYNTESGPAIFDMVYTGVETRDETYTQQNTQKYLGYFLMRYMENLSEGRNGGGWLDSFDTRNKLEDYISQILLTLFSNPREVTFFCLNRMLFADPLFVPLAGYILEEFDGMMPLLGQPLGLACYKPCHSSGEDFLHTYLGSLGIPLEPYARYPEEAASLLLTESAAQDSGLLAKIQCSLEKGGDVIITTGLLEKLQDLGLDTLSNIRVSRKKVLLDRFALNMLIAAFGEYTPVQKEVLFPELYYHTNDCFPDVVGMCHGNSFPILLEDRIAAGRLLVLAIPENMGDLYRLPVPVLDRIRSVLRGNSKYCLQGVEQGRLFLYDNGTLILQAGLPHNHSSILRSDGQGPVLQDHSSGEIFEGVFDGKKTRYSIALSPASYRVLCPVLGK